MMADFETDADTRTPPHISFTKSSQFRSRRFVWSASGSAMLTKGLPNFFYFLLEGYTVLTFTKEENVWVFVVTSGYLGLFLWQVKFNFCENWTRRERERKRERERESVWGYALLAVVQHVSGNICVHFTGHPVLNTEGVDTMLPQACSLRI